MTHPLSILVVDSRPVRRSRLVQTLQTHAECTIVGTLNFLPDAVTIATKLGANVVLVDGDQSEFESFHSALAALKAKGVGVVPIWAYPQSEFDTMRAELMTPGTGSYGLAENMHRLELLLSTLKAASARPIAIDTASQPTDTLQRKQAPRSSTTTSPLSKQGCNVIALGASTGGVQAIGTILASAPENSAPILIAQHMPDAFISGFAERLDRLSCITVKCAQDDEPLRKGYAYICPDTAHHLTLSPTSNSISLEASDPVMGHRPAVDRLFDSLVPVAHRTRCALLTGMGSDGAAAMSRLRARGAMTIAQSEATCTVFGMPRAAIDCEGAAEVIDLDKIAPALFT